MQHRYRDDLDVLGTRFRLHPQAPYVPGYQVPDIVWIRSSPREVGPGPSDDRIYVVDPAVEKAPYAFPDIPPYRGFANRPAEAAPDGHFDQFEPGSRAFIAAHAYGCVRRVIDIWESYLGAPIVWHFAADFDRLEIVPRLDWPNAQAGYGFLELGLERAPDGREIPFALNFDVVAHEIGHIILLSLLGVPGSVHRADFAAFHEASADLISLISFLHFDSGLDRLLNRAQGNLLTLNELNRIAELEGERQIRVASNARRMSEVTAELHDRSRPFTGAVFDTLVELYHTKLVERGLADQRLLEVDLKDFDAGTLDRVSAASAEAFRRRPLFFKSALVDARDTVASVLAECWAGMNADEVSFAGAAEQLVDRAFVAGEDIAAALLEENFRWREIL